ncbi:DUF7669 domain-containing protein [Thermogladius sp. 4427co]|uniref:DUF7669 domain-containing protein n=1 Tax=Thermogladius sp. 4427co TaxID=3450718 RepID=UPI003F7A8F9A
MGENAESQGQKKPNWLLIKEACLELVKSGKTVFSRREIINIAKQKDPSRSDMSLDFEIDLVTVNSNSKDRYKDPDKLFLFRVERGTYTLYDPEIHGPIERYIELAKFSPARKQVISQIIKDLEEKGFEVSENKPAKPISPDLTAWKDEKRIGVWVIDPSVDRATQLKNLYLAVGSSLLDQSFEGYFIVLPQDLADKISDRVREVLNSFNTKIIVLKEEKKYTLLI